MLNDRTDLISKKQTEKNSMTNNQIPSENKLPGKQAVEGGYSYQLIAMYGPYWDPNSHKL